MMASVLSTEILRYLIILCLEKISQTNQQHCVIMVLGITLESLPEHKLVRLAGQCLKVSEADDVGVLCVVGREGG